ncbi:hypothetical protein P170DRAFT_487283 [Aspergillus steynii IBT 23096]|uniref:Zn(2)-C6 fungal-type domain-containing protein n=1 Tax=Aspergillus steynii IBT 23096 TaxID=1392250 RepID=A0A2I2GEZ1_9EURO|nr:uncharacterized protein P170DRAFT_487283 [Aspergillus steynii IBT 23096]PLB51446.1 hypothetical protein P170DRAFT_487283 [Aspergillus steynii IBT 23096]
MGADKDPADRPRRARVERARRSKNGCATCLSKRVKCDEQRPYCGRCIRLHLPCEWPRPKASLAERRRGFGPLKRRDRDLWSPCSIVPKGELTPSLQPDESARQPMVTKANEQESNDAASGIVSQSSGNPPDLIDECEASGLLVPDGYEHDAAPSPSYGTPVSLSSSVLDSIHDTLPLLQMPLALPMSMSPDTSFIHVADTAPALGTNDKQALSFHRAVFAPLKSTRHWTCSAQALFVDRAFEKRMAFHFLLALSYSELAIYYGHGSRPPQESKRHFERGSHLFLQAQNPFAATDHVSTMLSFLYLYMFWMRRDRLDVTKLEDLSRTIMLYVRAHGLDDLCASEDLASLTGNSCTSLESPPDQALLARILVYLYDRDGFCGFFGCGGSFARHMSQDPEKRRKVWIRSRTAFLLPQTPCMRASAIFDMEDAATLDAYFDLIGLHQEINEYSQSSQQEAAEIEPRLRRRIDTVQQDHLFLPFSFPESDSRLSLMSYVTITFFHALQLYFYRSRESAFGQRPVSKHLQKTLNTLVSTAYHTVSTGPVQLLERFQWSLFIGALETHDPVHRQWLVDHISDPGLKAGTQLIQTIKHRSANGITMQNLRWLISGTNSAGLAGASR